MRLTTDHYRNTFSTQNHNITGEYRVTIKLGLCPNDNQIIGYLPTPALKELDHNHWTWVPVQTGSSYRCSNCNGTNGYGNLLELDIKDQRWAHGFEDPTCGSD